MNDDCIPRPLLTHALVCDRIFVELLHEVILPLYMRAQCNSILACIADDVDAAESYLRNERHVLDLFEERQPRDMEENIRAFRLTLDETAQDIRYRREHPEEELSEEEQEEGPLMHQSPSRTPRPGTDEDEEMLPGSGGDPEEPETQS